jgi:hypothetical protein
LNYNLFEILLMRVTDSYGVTSFPSLSVFLFSKYDFLYSFFLLF